MPYNGGSYGKSAYYLADEDKATPYYLVYARIGVYQGILTLTFLPHVDRGLVDYTNGKYTVNLQAAATEFEKEFSKETYEKQEDLNWVDQDRKISYKFKDLAQCQKVIYYFHQHKLLTNEERDNELKNLKNDYEKNLSPGQLNQQFNEILAAELKKYTTKVKNRFFLRGDPAMSDSRFASLKKIEHALAANSKSLEENLKRLEQNQDDNEAKETIRKNFKELLELVRNEVPQILAFHKVEGFLGGRFTNSNLAEHLTQALTKIDRVLNGHEGHKEFRAPLPPAPPQPQSKPIDPKKAEFERIANSLGSGSKH